MPLWLTDVGVAVALLVATELTFRMGCRIRPRYDEARRSQITTVQAASLGLLALLLGFTMSMADSRFNARRVVVLTEAAAVGTTYLRADFLPEPERSQSRVLLRGYVENRRAYFRASARETPAVTARGQAILDEVWEIAARVANRHPEWDLLTTYISSLNETIDLEAARDITVDARLPRTVNVVLLIAAMVAVGVTGFATGLSGARSILSMYVVPILIAVATSMILDIDRSRAGYISTGDRPMERLQRSLESSDEIATPG